MVETVFGIGDILMQLSESLAATDEPLKEGILYCSDEWRRKVLVIGVSTIGGGDVLAPGIPVLEDGGWDSGDWDYEEWDFGDKRLRVDELW